MTDNGPARRSAGGADVGTPDDTPATEPSPPERERGIAKTARQVVEAFGRPTISTSDIAEALGGIRTSAAAAQLAALSPEDRERVLSGSSITKLLAGLDAQQLAAVRDVGMTGSLRSYGQIVDDAMRNRDAAIERQRETSAELAKLPRVKPEEVRLLERVEAETKAVTSAVTDVYSQVALLAEISARQEANATAAGARLEWLTKVLVGLTAAIVILTVALVWIEVTR